MISPISIQDSCEALKKVMMDKCQQYDFDVAESIDVVSTFAQGWAMMCEIMVKPESKEKYKKYITTKDDLQDFEIPDNLEDME